MTVSKETLAEFLRVTLDLAISRFDDERHQFSRTELIGIFRANLTNPGDFSETIDSLFYFGFMDAASKKSIQYSGYYITDLGIEFAKNPDNFSLDESLALSDLQREIDSTSWTGLAKAIGPEHILLIRERGNELLSAIIQSDADITTRTDACKRVEAVLTLLEAPNVPWREIVGLLSHPTVTAFFAATSLLQFIVGLAN